MIGLILPTGVALVNRTAPSPTLVCPLAPSDAALCDKGRTYLRQDSQPQPSLEVGTKDSRALKYRSHFQGSVPSVPWHPGPYPDGSPLDRRQP